MQGVRIYVLPSQIDQKRNGLLKVYNRWPDGNLRAEPVPYQMRVYLFWVDFITEAVPGLFYINK